MSETLQAQLRIASGVHSVNKLFCLSSQHNVSSNEATRAAQISAPANQKAPEHEVNPGGEPKGQGPDAGVVVFFVGDRLEAIGLPLRVLELQNPKFQAALMARKFEGSSVAVVIPSRYEAGCASYDHFLHRTTATGEPLGYEAGGAAGYKAAAQLVSLLTSVGLWPDSCTSYSGQRGQLSSAGAASGAAETASSKHNAAPPVHLVGFSKGGVVLNQLLTELAEYSLPTQRFAGGRRPRPAVPLFRDLPRHPAGVPVAGASGAAPPLVKEVDKRAAELLRSLQAVHFLDAGLNGRGGYLTDPQVCESRARA